MRLEYIKLCIRCICGVVVNFKYDHYYLIVFNNFSQENIHINNLLHVNLFFLGFANRDA